MFEWLGDILAGMGEALGSAFGNIGEDIVNSVWNALVQWLYEAFYTAIGDLFADINNLGVEIFDLSWVQAVVNLFTMLGWSLFVVGVVVLEYVQSNLTQEDIQLLQRIESTMTEIETAMVEADFSGSVGAAQALYILALSDHAGQPGFVSRLVSCFAPEQTDDALIANVNREFGTGTAESHAHKNAKR